MRGVVWSCIVCRVCRALTTAVPCQITINVAKTAVVPKCPMPGHAWKSVVHDPKVTWLATWTENVMGQHKYVFLAASSGFKGEADLKKYEKARRLKKKIDTIRRAYTKMLKSKDNATRQMGTAIWVIDILALRVGNEKDEVGGLFLGCVHGARSRGVARGGDHDLAGDHRVRQTRSAAAHFVWSTSPSTRRPSRSISWARIPCATSKPSRCVPAVRCVPCAGWGHMQAGRSLTPPP